MSKFKNSEAKAFRIGYRKDGTIGPIYDVEPPPQSATGNNGRPDNDETEDSVEEKIEADFEASAIVEAAHKVIDDVAKGPFSTGDEWEYKPWQSKKTKKTKKTKKVKNAKSFDDLLSEPRDDTSGVGGQRPPTILRPERACGRGTAICGTHRLAIDSEPGYQPKQIDVMQIICVNPTSFHGSMDEVRDMFGDQVPGLSGFGDSDQYPACLEPHDPETATMVLHKAFWGALDLLPMPKPGGTMLDYPAHLARVLSKVAVGVYHQFVFTASPAAALAWFVEQAIKVATQASVAISNSGGEVFPPRTLKSSLEVK